MSVSEKAWDNYKKIEAFIDDRYQILSVGGKRIEHSKVSLAIQRLGESVLVYHNLDPKTHDIKKQWNIKIQHNKNLKLTTIEEMLSAEIVEWEDAINFEKVGYDTWSGRTADFRPQQSIENIIGIKSLILESFIETTPEQASNMLFRIDKDVCIELERLSKKTNADQKILEIRKALELLTKAVRFKFKIIEFIKKTITDEEKASIRFMDLYSVSSMLDARIGERSLRQALNLSTDSWMSQSFGLQEALWGKTTSLENVEKAI